MENVNLPPTRTTKTIQRALREFRHSIALSIFRYAQDTLCSVDDIQAHDDLVELCDEYSLRVLISWLATKNGCSAYSSSIYSSSKSRGKDLCAPLRMACAFPYTTELLDELSVDLEAELHSKLDFSLSPDLSLIGTLYELICGEVCTSGVRQSSFVLEDIHDSDNRKSSGQFYTPAGVVNYCLSKALSKDSQEFMKAIKANAKNSLSLQHDETALNKPVFKMLDPSCGSGNFLIGALDWLKQSGCTPDEIISFAIDSLYGIEIDPRAASLARLTVLLFIGREIADANASAYGGAADTDQDKLISRAYRELCDHIIESDTILESIYVVSDFREIGDSRLWLKDFDLVITNPPYISFGARNQPKLPQSSSTFLRHLFPSSAQYKINFYSVFQDICIRYAKYGARVVLLVPDSFLTGQYFEKLREHILLHTKILSLSELPANTIPGAVVGRWCVAVYERCEPGQTQKETKDNHTVDLVSFGKAEGAENPRRYNISLGSMVSKDRSRFRLLFHQIDEQIVNRLDELPPMSTVIRGHTGIRALNGRDSIVSNAKGGEKWKRGLTSGRQVVPYRAEWDGQWLNVDASMLFGGGFNPNIIEKPKIMTRQTGDSLIAAIDTTGLYHLNNVHSFSPTSTSISIHALLAIFNSQLFRYLYRLKTREGGRALAQIDIETVESLPIAIGSGRTSKALSVLAQRIESLSNCQESRGNCRCCDKNLISFTRRCVDRLVYELYRISELEIEHIEGFVRPKSSAECETLGVEEALSQAGL